MVVVVVVVGVGWWGGGCWGLGKQDFISHEKCRELQLSDIELKNQIAFFRFLRI